MVNFSDENKVEIIKLLGAVLEELQKINESIAKMDASNANNFNSVLSKIDSVKYSIDNIGPIEVYE